MKPQFLFNIFCTPFAGKVQEEVKAMDHYTIALNLNPRNLPAQEGLQKLEQSTDTGLSGAGGGGGGGAGGGASSTAAGSAASERTYDIDMDGTSGDGGNFFPFFAQVGFNSVVRVFIL